jgi:hypothetical protein
MLYETRLFRYGILSRVAEEMMQKKGAQKGKASAGQAVTDMQASEAAAPAPSAPQDSATEARPQAIAAPAAPAVSSDEVRRLMPRPVNRVDAAREQAKGKDDWRRHLTPREEPQRPSVPARVAGTRSPLATPVILASGDEAEHRHFPRAEFNTRVELWMDEPGGKERRFSAMLQSVNVSVSGAFVESTFFLPVGTELNVRFALEEGAEPVQARAEIVREERTEGPEGRTGFGIRFVEFSGQTEVSLARLFLGMKLRAFAEEYMQSRRARGLPNELERVVDVLAAWELMKATTPGNPWRGE